MKKILLGVCSIAFLLGCSSPDSSKAKNDPADQDHSTATQDSHDHDAAMSGTASLTDGIPALNNGEKWEADQSTNDNVANLQSIVKDFEKNASPAVEDYRNFNENFTGGINKMVNECKMQGPDHDALHVWLEPLMKDNNEMKTIDSKEVLEGKLRTIHERLNIYPQYFE